MGLRLKFNLLLAPIVAAALIIGLWADYRHESAMVMEAHAMHTTLVGSAVVTQPIDEALLPVVVANRSLRTHVLVGAVLLVLLIAAVNAALHVFIFGPLGRLGDRLARMEHGHWGDLAAMPVTGDELGQFVQKFALLGPEIDALVGQSLRAEYLAALALLAHQLRGRLEPELAHMARIAVRLNAQRDESVRNLGGELARAVAGLMGWAGQIDRVFAGPPAGAASRPGVPKD